MILKQITNSLPEAMSQKGANGIHCFVYQRPTRPGTIDFYYYPVDKPNDVKGIRVLITNYLDGKKVEGEIKAEAVTEKTECKFSIILFSLLDFLHLYHLYHLYDLCDNAVFRSKE